MKEAKVVAVVVVVAVAAWFFRDPLLKQFRALRGDGPPAVSQEAPAPRKDTVYKWVDEDGVPHYDQRPRDGSEAVVIDQGKIRSMEEVSESGSPVVALPQGEGAE